MDGIRDLRVYLKVGDRVELRNGSTGTVVKVRKTCAKIAVDEMNGWTCTVTPPAILLII